MKIKFFSVCIFFLFLLNSCREKIHSEKDQSSLHCVKFTYLACELFSKNLDNSFSTDQTMGRILSRSVGISKGVVGEKKSAHGVFHIVECFSYNALEKACESALVSLNDIFPDTEIMQVHGNDLGLIYKAKPISYEIKQGSIESTYTLYLICYEMP